MRALLIASLIPSLCFGGELPYQLESLNKKHEKKIKEVNAVYVKELKKVRSKLTKSGDLDGANMASEFILKHEPKKVEKPKEDKSKYLFKGDEVTSWSWGYGGTLTINPDGTAYHTHWNGKKCKWTRVSGSEITMDGKDRGSKHRISFKNSMFAEVQFSSNRNHKTTLTKKR